MFKNLFKSFFKQESPKPKASNALPREAQVYLAAIHQLQNGKYLEALTLFNEIIASDNFGIDPDQDAGLLYNRSIAKSNLRDYRGAIDDLERSIEIFEIPQANFEIFRINHELGKTNEGMSYLVRAYKMGYPQAEEVLRNNTNYFNNH